MGGCVYAVEFKNKIKIGTTSNFKKRIEYLRCINKEKEINYFFSENTENNFKSEAIIKKLLKKHKLYGEYFRYDFKKACKIVKKTVKNQDYLSLEYEVDYDNLVKNKITNNVVFTKQELIKYFGKAWFKYNYKKRFFPLMVRERYILQKLKTTSTPGGELRITETEKNN